MPLYPSVSIVSDDGEETLTLCVEADGSVSFDPSSTDAGFRPARVTFALEFLAEVIG